MYIFGTYRPERIGNVNFNDISLNGTYTPSFYINNQFADWEQAGLTKIIDNIIPEDRYTGEIIPGIPKLTRFILAEYNEAYVDGAELSRSITNVGARFDIDMFADLEKARQWIRDNTNLIEETPGKFLISEQSIGMNEEIIPAKFLIID